MLKSKTIEIDGIGRVLLVRSKRARRLNISVKPFTGARVAIPYGLSFESAEKIALSKASWIKRHLNKVKEIEKRQAAVSNDLTEIDRALARKKLTLRLNELSSLHGFTYNRVFIRNQKTRWGSCSARNNINLNMNLLRLPKDLIDYVILHELVHTREKNHSKNFWAELNKFVGDAGKLKSRLKEYSL
ncbi:MAG: YgjP-like metallopeptidase domain-containing protein [Thermodesulfobacteriota bacterium]|nr:YgjP-like metallopeptidase domain-containing protein [Thermodesulfobacteriota bacterium]